VEAILAGGRVAATPTAAYREAADDSAIFASNSSVGAVAEAMRAALGQSPSSAGRARLADRFGAPAVSAALLDAYRDLGVA
jgi:hypothetical protein